MAWRIDMVGEIVNASPAIEAEMGVTAPMRAEIEKLMAIDAASVAGMAISPREDPEIGLAEIEAKPSI
jgi:hypothetical protein